MVSEEDPSPYTAGKRVTGKNKGVNTALLFPRTPVLLPFTEYEADRTDSVTVKSGDEGAGDVRTLAWNPGLHRYNNSEWRTRIFGYRPGNFTTVPQEYNGTRTRMRERGTREGIPLLQDIRINRNDTPRFFTIPGDSRNTIPVQYFSRCSDGSENNGCKAPGIMPAVMTRSGCTDLPANLILTGPLVTRSGFSESLVFPIDSIGDLSLTRVKQEVSVF
jgi:hypothetical protein